MASKCTTNVLTQQKHLETLLEGGVKGIFLLLPGIPESDTIH